MEGKSFEKRKVAKVRVEPKSNGIPDVKHNHYATSNTAIAWQIDLFILIASRLQSPCHKTECLRLNFQLATQ